MITDYACRERNLKAFIYLCLEFCTKPSAVNGAQISS